VFLDTRCVYIRYKQLRGYLVTLNLGSVITDSTACSLRDYLANPGDFSYRILDSLDYSLEALSVIRRNNNQV
jgi:hypothetical protein